MGIIGRLRRKNDAGNREPTEYERGRDDGITSSERMFCDTIKFQDSYISALEREIAALRKKVEKQSHCDTDA